MFTVKYISSRDNKFYRAVFDSMADVYRFLACVPVKEYRII